MTALVESPDHVCCRYRIAAFRDHWKRTGFDLQVQPLPRRWWNRLGLLARSTFHAAILQRRLISSVELQLVRNRTKHLVFDLDDAVWMRDSFSKRGLHSPRRLGRFAAIVRAADAVIAGNDFLAQHSARFTSPDRIHVIPTCVEPTRYVPADHRRSGARLVWVGSLSTLQGLRSFAPVLDQIGRTVPGIRLKLICDEFLTLAQMAVEPCRWSEATEAAEISTADIGIAWMPDDEWSRGKCGLKVLQYMAAGLPVVANAVGVHCEMIHHGENGFLVESPTDWIDAVRTLAGNPELRRKMGATGRQRVERDYSVKRGAELWTGVLSSIVRVAA